MAEAVWVVAGGDEELSGGLVADAVDGEERGGDVVEDGLDVTRESSRASSSKARQRRATVINARFAATSTVVVVPGRHRSANATFLRKVTPASWERRGSGAVSHRLWSWFGRRGAGLHGP